jgi:hypothetical protein
MLGEVPELSRRRLCLGVSAAAVSGLAVAQTSTRAAILRTDLAGLLPYGNSTLPSGIRSRVVTDISGLAMHVLEAGFEPKGRQCITQPEQIWSTVPH